MLFDAVANSQFDSQGNLTGANAESRDHRIGLDGGAGLHGDLLRLHSKVAQHRIEIDHFHNHFDGAVVREPQAQQDRRSVARVNRRSSLDCFLWSSSGPLVAAATTATMPASASAAAATAMTTATAASSKSAGSSAAAFAGRAVGCLVGIARPGDSRARKQGFRFQLSVKKHASCLHVRNWNLAAFARTHGAGRPVVCVFASTRSEADGQRDERQALLNETQRGDRELCWIHGNCDATCREKFRCYGLKDCLPEARRRDDTAGVFPVTVIERAQT